MMPDERMLLQVMLSTMQMVHDSFAGPLHALMLPSAQPAVPKHSCI